MLTLLFGMLLTALAQGEFEVDPDEVLRALQYQHCITSEELEEYKDAATVYSPAYYFNASSLHGDSGRLDRAAVNLALMYMEREQYDLFVNWVSVDPNIYASDFAKNTNRISQRHRNHLKTTIKRLERRTDVVQEMLAQGLVVKIRQAAEKEHVITAEALRYLEISDNLRVVEGKFRIWKVTEFVPTYPDGKFNCERFSR